MLCPAVSSRRHNGPCRSRALHEIIFDVTQDSGELVQETGCVPKLDTFAVAFEEGTIDPLNPAEMEEPFTERRAGEFISGPVPGWRVWICLCHTPENDRLDWAGVR
jgi:hypothetical protein